MTKSGKKIMTLQSINCMEEVLPGNLFFRVHRSHIVNISHADAIEDNTLRIGQEIHISLSKNKRSHFIQRIDKAN